MWARFTCCEPKGRSKTEMSKHTRALRATALDEHPDIRHAVRMPSSAAVLPQEQQPDLSSWPTMAEAAVQLGTNERTIRRWIDTGRLKDARRPAVGRKPLVIVDPDDVDRLAQRAPAGCGRRNHSDANQSNEDRTGFLRVRCARRGAAPCRSGCGPRALCRSIRGTRGASRADHGGVPGATAEAVAEFGRGHCLLRPDAGMASERSQRGRALRARYGQAREGRTVAFQQGGTGR